LDHGKREKFPTLDGSAVVLVCVNICERSLFDPKLSEESEQTMKMANQRAAGDSGIALRLQIGRHWPAAPEHDRSIKRNGSHGGTKARR
jgi:hypothetical protein